MEKRHSDILDSTLEVLSYEPMVKLSKRQLRYFYSMERLSKYTWAELFGKLPSWITRDDLYVVEDGDGVYLVKQRECKSAADFVKGK